MLRLLRDCVQREVSQNVKCLVVSQLTVFFFQSDECLLLKTTNSQYGEHKARCITIFYPEYVSRNLLFNMAQMYERTLRYVPVGRNFNTEESRQAANETT